MGKNVLSLNDLKKAAADGITEISVDTNTILTPSAKDFVLTGKVKIIKKCNPDTISAFPTEKLKIIIRSIAKNKNIDFTENDLSIITERVLRQIS